LTFFVEVAVFLFIPIILQTDLCFAQLTNLNWEFLKDLHTGVLLTVLLFGSVGLGYIFSIFHHLFISFLIDHRQMLENAILNERLKLYLAGQREHEILPSDLRKKGAWVVVTGIWHEMKEKSDLIKSANPRIESLTDIMHGSGTTSWGSIFAALLGWLIYHKFFSACTDLYYIVIPLFIVIPMHFWNFCNTIKACQGVVEIVLSDELRLQKNMRNKPIEIIVSKREIRKKWVMA
jgi:hypothetical protein